MIIILNIYSNNHLDTLTTTKLILNNFILAITYYLYQIDNAKTFQSETTSP